MKYSDLLQKYIGKKGMMTYPGYGVGLSFTNHMGNSTLIKEIGDDFEILETDGSQQKYIEVIPLNLFQISDVL